MGESFAEFLVRNPLPPPARRVVALNGPRWSAIGRHDSVELTMRAEGEKAHTHLAVRFTPGEARAIAAALTTLAGETDATAAEDVT